MSTAKEDAQKVLDRLPDESSLEEIQDHLYVLQRIQRGRRDIDEGRVVPQGEIERRMEQWLER